jgi:hypothetical protein
MTLRAQGHTCSAFAHTASCPPAIFLPGRADPDPSGSSRMWHPAGCWVPKKCWRNLVGLFCLCKCLTGSVHKLLTLRALSRSCPNHADQLSNKRTNTPSSLVFSPACAMLSAVSSVMTASASIPFWPSMTVSNRTNSRPSRSSSVPSATA